MNPRHATVGFTLIELVIVIGLLAALAGGIGIALRGGNPSASFRTGQATVAALLNVGRSEAASLDARVMVVVDGDPRSGEFLRRLLLVAETAADTDQWQALDDGVLLPDGVYLVPADLNLTGISVRADAAPWPVEVTSSLKPAAPGAILGRPVVSPEAWLRMVRPFGTAGGGGERADDRIVLAPGRRIGSGVEFSRPAMAQGVVLSDYGLPLLIEEAGGFGF